MMTMNDAFGPIHMPDRVWRSGPVHTALRRRDAAEILRLVRQHADVSQNRLAGAVGILQGRLSEILNGTRTITAFEVYQRIADGLNMPDHARLTFGLAPRQPAAENVAFLDIGEVLDIYPNRTLAEADLRATARNASDIRVHATYALHLIGSKDSVLADAITRPKRPPSTTILLSKRDSASVAVGTSADSPGEDVRRCLAYLVTLRRGGMAVYLHDAAPIWQLVGLDDTLYVTGVPTHPDGPEPVTYKIVRAPGGVLHPGLMRTFQDLQNGATRAV